MSLLRYIDSQRGKSFQLGSHDCFTFTNGAWKEVYGHGYADDFIGTYDGLGPKAFANNMVNHFGSANLEEAFDSRWTRSSIDELDRGGIVLSATEDRYYTRHAIGIKTSPVRAVFVGAEDLVYKPLNDCFGGWICQRL